MEMHVFDLHIDVADAIVTQGGRIDDSNAMDIVVHFPEGSTAEGYIVTLPDGQQVYPERGPLEKPILGFV